MGTPSRLVVLGVLVVGAVVALALLLVRPLLAPEPVVQAVETLPGTVVRVSWTDWAEVQQAAGGDVGTASSQADVDDFLDRAFEEDLVGSTALGSSFRGLEKNFGVTPLDAEWEVYGQAPEGSVAVLRFSDDVDLDEVEGRFEALGYQAPGSGAGEGGTWVGEVDQVAGLPGPLTQVQENLAVLADEHLLLMGDDPEFVDRAVDVVRGDEEGLDEVPGLGSLLGELEEPAVATVWVNDYACEELAMSQADPSDVAEGQRLVDEAGGVNPLTGLAFAETADAELQFVFAFDSAEDASEDLQPRTDLASGPAAGQGGSFTDRFEIVSSTADGPLVTMRAEPVAGQVLADVGQGPVLFATC